MAESPENKNSENTLSMRLSAVFLTIRGNKKRKKSKVKKKKKLFYVNEWREFLYATDKKIVYRINNSIVSYN